MILESKELKKLFRNVYFINGLAYAGKSTMVRLLAEKYDGIECRENYHDERLSGLDPKEFPNLCWSRDLVDWHEFIRRTPDEYERWIDGVTLECEKVELEILSELAGREPDRKIFVDTNIRPETLHRVADPSHVLIMLADRDISVRRFFDRPDREKQFLYRLMLEEPDPQKALANFRRCIERVNSQERYEAFENCGFNVIYRDETRGVDGTLALVEELFGLKQ